MTGYFLVQFGVHEDPHLPQLLIQYIYLLNIEQGVMYKEELGSISRQ